jgi:formate dehydrogenase assembly factor FdhD
MAQAAFLAQGFFGGASALLAGESAGQNARAKEKELRRQQIRETEIAREKKSDIARETDIEIGTLLAASADTGQTTAGIARGTGEIAGIAGLDKARVESNRQEIVASLQIARQQNVRQARLVALSSMLNMFGAVAGGAGQAASIQKPGEVPSGRQSTSGKVGGRSSGRQIRSTGFGTGSGRLGGRV